MKFEKEFTYLKDLKPGDFFAGKNGVVGSYVKRLDNGGYLLRSESTGKEYEVTKCDYKFFKSRKSSFSKKDYVVKSIDKKVAYEFVKTYHYLGDAKFFSKFSFGVYKKGSEDLLGVTTFSNPQGNVALKGWFGLPNTDQTVLELSRLCVLPNLNGSNITSFLLSTSLRLLKKDSIRSVITLADDSRHSGSIYQVCNFTYYGLTNKKSDFFSYDDGGKVNPRGATKTKQGVWIPRTQKHRYAFIMDKSLKCLYTETTKPSKDDTKDYDCCDGSKQVYDKRFKVNYTCPKCTGILSVIDD